MAGTSAGFLCGLSESGLLSNDGDTTQTGLTILRKVRPPGVGSAVRRSASVQQEVPRVSRARWRPSTGTQTSLTNWKNRITGQRKGDR